ncbi:hypothetical protein Y032_0596g445 [Ancylostoma ceylanicum]|uniref:Oxidoreductase, short chain dehydrogenase/reductase family protein n=1 Tax=Ancylostoma ceylanicum TaxID=53326 RepID=A0A016WMI3_9BILA|nr:hypothetical protein Y032_0596g445 [Ancylostoma ceylanicum]
MSCKAWPKTLLSPCSSSGIGAETAVLFAKEGAKVTITGRKKDGLEATKRCILNAGGKEDDINAVVADVTDASGREEIISSTVQKWGKIDILVNNAGGMLRDTNGSADASASVDVLRKTMDLNVCSVVHLIQLARPYLVKQKERWLTFPVLVGSLKGHQNSCTMRCQKPLLDQMTRSLAVDLIAEGVRVNSVSPGAVVTRFMQTSGVTDADASKVDFLKLSEER